ncbi:MAG: hypothetical protein SFX73_04160 [Kofleriaceae bacterium]|nr:hypothetical protein [Kofleriaceae bacterium]
MTYGSRSLTGFEACDRTLIDELKRWRYPLLPVDSAKACTAITFLYSQR